MKRKEEIKSKALEYAMFPTNSYSETARISFEQGAEWADENPDGKMLLHVLNKGVKQGKREMLDTLWKSADGDDLPEIDREVIALVWENEHYKVVFAHRPPEYWDGKNIITNEVTRYEPKTYDAGGWNIPDVKWWLDLDLPKMED